MQAPLIKIPCLLFCISFLSSCADDDSKLFTRLSPGRTGIQFKNILKEDENSNVLNYAYFYNGGGVAVGDVNGDGLQDILFTGNMVRNRLYLNKGNFEFEDITERSGVAKKQGWCTGATMADINGDGRLDIYICRSADVDGERRKNLLFINNGDSTFTERAEEYGLADKGYSTQASFFDYDKDGDLDMVLINHSLEEYSTAGIENSSIRNQKNSDFAVKLYRNDNGHFRDVSESAGIYSNVLTFGLGLAVSDINNDGWPDLYISNDFNEPDYLFINNGNGTFTERLRDCMDAASLYSMGSDFADYDNDGRVDLITLDMLDESNHAQKMHSGAENFNKFQMLFQNGFYYQYSRNMLHHNNGDGTFSEIGQAAGISNTSWSWSALFTDLDNDGNKDLVVTNGYKKDFTDMDFIKYRMNKLSNERKGGPKADVGEMLRVMPSISAPGYLFRNNGDQTFLPRAAEWGFDEDFVSSGAAYADLDNDGSMDLIVSRIDDEAGIYKSNARKLFPGNHYLKIRLQGAAGNGAGIGAKVKVYCGKALYYQEQSPVRGFQSSVDQVLNVGLGKSERVDSLIVIWPDNKIQKLRATGADRLVTVRWQDADEVYGYDSAEGGKKFFRADSSILRYRHKENIFNDFSMQRLLPNFLSRQGPCMAKADINRDGREDIFIGGSKGHPGQLFLQDSKGVLAPVYEPDIAKDSASEDAGAVFFDADGDGDTDLYVASGGYEFGENDAAFQDRLYFNDGNGKFKKRPSALPGLLFSKSCVSVVDINEDGAPDLFIGGRVVPGRYPLSPGSRILLNDGKGNFRDVTGEAAPGLARLGMVTDAVWTDIGDSHRKGLVVVGEWMPVRVFAMQDGRLKDVSSEYIHFPSSGWWNKVVAEDMDGDGDMDLVLGNAGLNTQFKASEGRPLSLYFKDFDNNGTIDPILCYYIKDSSYPAASRDDLMGQIPSMQKRFLEYGSYADATIDDIFSKEQLKDAGLLKATELRSLYLENRGKDGYVVRQLPAEAQYAPVYSIGATDVNRDGKKDLVMAGNNAWTRIRFGRYRANHGMVFLGDGRGNFSYVGQQRSGLSIRADIRSSAILRSGGREVLLFGANDAPVISYVLNEF